MNIHSYRSNVNGRTAEHNLANDMLTIFEGGSILVELDVHQDNSPGAIWSLIEADYDAMYEEAEAIIAAAEAPAAKTVKIGERHGFENYGMRGHSGRRSDRVTRYNRKIGAQTFEFSRVQWAAGGTTLRAYVKGSATPVHELHF